MEEHTDSNAERPEQLSARASRSRPSAKYWLHATAFLCLLVVGALVFRTFSCRSEPSKIDPHIRGQLRFGSLDASERAEKRPFEGTDVAEERNNRKYIGGHPDSPQRAIWDFDKLPQSVKSPEGDLVSAKLTCAIFRLAERDADDAIVTIRAVSHTCPQAPPRRGDTPQGVWQWTDQESWIKYQKATTEYRAKGIDLRTAKPGTDGWKTVNQLAEEYGYYEVQLPKVLDLAETSIDLPAGLFRNALKNKPEARAIDNPKRPQVSIYVKCETGGLLLGMAESDLYLVEIPAPKR